MALRATYGDAGAAVEWILRRREEKEEIKKQEKENRQRRKLQKQLGNCDNGQPVRVTFMLCRFTNHKCALFKASAAVVYKTLVISQVNTRVFLQLKEMGFSPTLVQAALRRANNDMNVAIQLLGDDRFLQEARAKIVLPPSSAESSGPSTSAAAAAALAERIAANLPATTTPSGSALGSVPQQTPINPELLQSIADQLFENNLHDEFLGMDEADIAKSQKAYESLTKDTCSESEYLDLTLSAETQYLDQYKVLVASL